MRIYWIIYNAEGPPLSDWDPTHALELWYMDKTRRLNIHMYETSAQLQEGLKLNVTR